MSIANRIRAILPDSEVASGGTPPGSGEARRLSLALQGGGSLGAFAWGVLDALLEQGVRFDAVSGSSAGAVNAVLLASGLANGGPDRARELLERFWRHASEAASMQFVNSMFSWSGPLLSPYQFNPLDISPLRSLLRAEVDFDMLRQRSPIRLLIGATRVADGRLRIFRESELTAEAIMARPACRRSARRSRSTATPIGTAAFRPTHR